jgi:hypothetical protein
MYNFLLLLFWSWNKEMCMKPDGYFPKFKYSHGRTIISRLLREFIIPNAICGALRSKEPNRQSIHLFGYPSTLLDGLRGMGFLATAASDLLGGDSDETGDLFDRYGRLVDHIAIKF